MGFLSFQQSFNKLWKTLKTEKKECEKPENDVGKPTVQQGVHASVPPDFPVARPSFLTMPRIVSVLSVDNWKIPGQSGR